MYAVEDVVIEPGETKLIRLGLAFELPPGYVALLMVKGCGKVSEKIDDLHEMLIDLQMYITVSGIPDEEAIYLEERINEIRNKVFELETFREERCIHCGDALNIRPKKHNKKGE